MTWSQCHSFDLAKFGWTGSTSGTMTEVSKPAAAGFWNDYPTTPFAPIRMLSPTGPSIQHFGECGCGKVLIDLQGTVSGIPLRLRLSHKESISWLPGIINDGRVKWFIGFNALFWISMWTFFLGSPANYLEWRFWLNWSASGHPNNRPSAREFVRRLRSTSIRPRLLMTFYSTFLWSFYD